MRWAEFEASAPALAALGRELFDRSQLVMLGTLRSNGWPRVTPLEYAFYEGDLFVGGMWKSRKLRDLERDSRLVLHSSTSDKAGTQGDFKLYGHALSQEDATLRARYAQFAFELTGFRPVEPFHLFRVDITEAAFVAFGDTAKSAASRLGADPSTSVRMIAANPNTSGYVVAAWKAGRPA